MLRERVEDYSSYMHGSGLKRMLAQGISTLEGTQQWLKTVKMDTHIKLHYPMRFQACTL
jgi:hypothetical protein